MNWSDIGNAIVKYAPLSAGALSSPLGAAGAVGSVFSSLFGVEASPEKIMDAIKGDPKKAQELILGEMQNNLALRELCLKTTQEENRHEEKIIDSEVQDRISSRFNSENINKSPVDNKIKMILVIGVFLIVFLCIGALVFADGINKDELPVLANLLNLVAGALIMMISFYWGASYVKSLMKNSFDEKSITDLINKSVNASINKMFSEKYESDHFGNKINPKYDR